MYKAESLHFNESDRFGFSVAINLHCINSTWKATHIYLYTIVLTRGVNPFHNYSGDRYNFDGGIFIMPKIDIEYVANRIRVNPDTPRHYGFPGS